MIKSAGFWRRLAAHLVDSIILGIPILLIAFMGLQKYLVHAALFSPFGPNLIYFAATAVYYAGFLSSGWQATPGKRLLGVYVVRAQDGGALSKARALARLMAFNLPLWMVFGLIFFANPAVNAAKQFSEIDQQRLSELSEKSARGKVLSSEEQQFLTITTTKMLFGNLPQEDQQKMMEIQTKHNARETLTPEEEAFEKDALKRATMPMVKIFVPLELLAGSYLLAMSLVMGLTREKKGFHDMICKTRALRGRPEKPIFVDA